MLQYTPLLLFNVKISIKTQFNKRNFLTHALLSVSVLSGLIYGFTVD